MLPSIDPDDHSPADDRRAAIAGLVLIGSVIVACLAMIALCLVVAWRCFRG